MAAHNTSPLRSQELAPGLLFIGTDLAPSQPRLLPKLAHLLLDPPDRDVRPDRNARKHESTERSRSLRFRNVSAKSRATVLAAREFETFLARERELADRGTRVFTLVVLDETSGDSHGVHRLAQKLRDRLRSTDLIGRLGHDQLALLLSDTGSEGARVVGGWIERAADELGIRLDSTIYVYPTVREERERAHDDDDTHLDGHASRFESEQDDQAPIDGTPVDGLHRRSTPGNGNAFASVANWPMADLWPELTAQIPKWKRAFDIVVSALALLALSPLFLLVAIAIKLDSPGPVIFKQSRAGRGGRAFAFYKFRSMFVDAERRRAALAALNEQSGPVFKMHDDPRITRIGRYLRRWSIDELPQLWNILIGDISLVGPRSPTFDEVVQYERWQRRRLSVTGGVTCIWQVSGRSQIAFRDWMRLDMKYIRDCGLWLDLCLLARTLPAIVSGRGAY